MAQGMDAVPWLQALLRDVDTYTGADGASHKLEVSFWLPR
jgi:hypothetical protein